MFTFYCRDRKRLKEPHFDVLCIPFPEVAGSLPDLYNNSSVKTLNPVKQVIHQIPRIQGEGCHISALGRIFLLAFGEAGSSSLTALSRNPRHRHQEDSGG